MKGFGDSNAERNDRKRQSNNKELEGACHEKNNKFSYGHCGFLQLLYAFVCSRC